MAAKKSTQLVIIGVAVFVIGASLVFLGLRSGGGAKQAVTPTPAAAAQTDNAVTPVRVAGQGAAAVSVAIPKGMEAVAVKLDHVAGLAGYAKPGDVVNLYAAVKTEGTIKRSLRAPWARLVLSNVKVLDVSGALAGQDGSEATFLLALSPADAEVAIFFAKFESLWATLVPKGAPAASTTGIDLDEATR